MKTRIPIETSNHHIHLTEKDIEKLFGKGYKPKPLKPLSQKGEFSAKETVTLIYKNKKLNNVRIVGPPREQTQIELSQTTARKLKINAPLKLSGDLNNTPGITILGPKGKIKTKQGVIIAKRHLHISPSQAKKLKLKNKQKIKIKIPGERETTFSNIIVRIKPNYNLALHLDTDEANAAGIKGKTYGEIVK